MTVRLADSSSGMLDPTARLLQPQHMFGPAIAAAPRPPSLRTLLVGRRGLWAPWADPRRNHLPYSAVPTEGKSKRLLARLNGLTAIHAACSGTAGAKFLCLLSWPIVAARFFLGRPAT